MFLTPSVIFSDIDPICFCIFYLHKIKNKIKASYRCFIFLYKINEFPWCIHFQVHVVCYGCFSLCNEFGNKGIANMILISISVFNKTREMSTISV